MPRRNKGARLWLRRRRGRAAIWVILDHGREISTDAGEDDIGAAESALAQYIGLKRRPDFGNGHPAKILIADALAEYGEKHAPTTRRPDLIGAAISKLLDFFGDRTVATVTNSTCSSYVHWRVSQTDARASQTGRPIMASTARRELVVLGAALRWCWKEGKIDQPIPISLPPQAGPRERHLSRSEVAALLAGALGWDHSGVRHRAKINRHLARFILVALYTGTRHDAILRLQWMPNVDGGWIDLAAGVLYRRPTGAVDSIKRRPPVSHTPSPFAASEALARADGAVRHRICRTLNPLPGTASMAHGARPCWGLGPDVTPHILRHTCATMLLQLGVSVYDVAGVLGTAEDVIRRTYGHHAQDHLRHAVAAFSHRFRP